MAGTTRYVPLETRTARQRLRPGKPYWRALDPGLAVGYKRRQTGQPGRWIMRTYQGGERYSYSMATLATADDYVEADGVSILTFEQASGAARTAFSAGTGAPALSVLTVGDALREYLEFLKLHRATARDTERRINAQILPALGRIRLSELTALMIIKWRDDLARSPARMRTPKGERQRFRPVPAAPDALRKRKSTVNRVLKSLRAALNLAFQNGHVTTDTAWRRVKLFERADAARTNSLDIEEGKRLIAACEGDFKILVQGALWTGARYGELCAMRVGDFKRGKLHIPKTKTGKERDVRLNKSAIDFFEKLTADRKPDEFMFLHNGKQWTRTCQFRPMRAASAKAGIIPAVSFHLLKHSYISNAIMRGMSFDAVGNNVGTSAVVIERNYKHLSTGYLDKMIEDHAPNRD
jgi:integrase